MRKEPTIKHPTKTSKHQTKGLSTMAEPELPQGRKITISFRKSTDYRIFSATDVYGGPTADGAALFFNLTIDHFPTPSYQTFATNEKGQVNLADARETITAGDVEKELLCGVMFTPDVAIKIGQWLVSRGQELKGHQR